MMKRLFNIIALLSVYAFTSCDLIMDDAACITLGGSSHKVTFTLAVDDASLNTRAAWSEGYQADSGTSYDNRIAYDGLQVLVYDNDNRYVGQVGSLIHWAVSATEYRFSGDITELSLIVGEKYKIMVFANCPDLTQNVGSQNFSIDDIVYPSGYLPMWGVTTMTVANEELQDVGNIDLIRAVAKVEVELSDEMLARGYSLDNVSVRNYNTNGYCVPAGWDNVASTSLLDQENCMNAYHSHVGESLGFVEGEAQKSRWLYIPEFNVLHTATNRPVMTVVLNDGTSAPLEFKDAISFGEYVNGAIKPGTEYNIVRNHIYRYTISGISAGIEISYEVLPWTDGGTWERGEFAYPTYHNPLLPELPTESNSSPVITSDPVMSYNNSNPENGAFSAWFKIEAPVGQTWLPVVDKANTQYNILVYKNGTLVYDQNNSHTTENLVASNDWYNIKVIPLNPDNAGDVVEFGITYIQDWMPDNASIYLFINGKVDEIAWPNSGNDPKIIQIRQN